MVVRFNPENIAFAGSAQGLLDIADASPRIRPFKSRSDEAHSSSVVSIDAPVIHSLLAMETY